MKKIAFTLAFLAALMTYSLMKRKDKNLISNAISAKSVTTAKDLLNLPIDKSELSNITGTPPDCAKAWMDLMDYSFAEITANVGVLRDALGSIECLQSSGYSQNELLLKECAGIFENNIDKDSEKKSLEKCASTLIFYRAYVIHESTKNQKDYKNMSTRLLINKLAALINSQGVKDLKMINTIAEALAENEPHLYAAQKANLVAKTLSLTSENPNSESFSQTLDAYEESLKRLDSFENEDQEAYEAKLLPDILKSDYAALNRKLSEIIEKEGESAFTSYYQSALAWKAKNTPLAYTYLDKAIALDPPNKTYRETRKKIASLNPGEAGAYVLNMSFDFMTH